MACVVSLTLYGFFSKPKTSVQVACQRQLAGGRLSTAVTRSMNFDGPKYLDGGIFTVNERCFSMKTLTRRFCQPISRHFSIYIFLLHRWIYFPLLPSLLLFNLPPLTLLLKMCLGYLSSFR